jgi:O-antigen/teichoic acid export membrane protein
MFSAITTKLTKSKFIKNSLIVASGTAIAQLISVGISPILTRTYTPEAFGVMGVFMAVSAVIGVGSTGRYDMAIVLPKDEKDASNLLGLSALIASAIGFVMLILLPVNQLIAKGLDAHIIAPYLFLLPVSISVIGLASAMEYWSVRHKKFKLVANARIAGSLSSSFWLVVVGCLWASPLVLILGMVSNNLFRLLFFVNRSWGQLFESLNKDVHIPGLRHVAYQNRSFPKFRATNDVINSLSQNAPALLLSVFFSTAQVGLFWLAFRVLSLPGALISNAIRKVFYQKAAETHNKGLPVFGLALKMTAGLSMVAAGPLFIVVLFAPELFSWVFGSGWAVAGEYARWLSIWVFFLFINVPSVVLGPILGFQGMMLVFEVVSIFLRVSSLVSVAIITNNDIYSVAAFSVAASVSNIILIIAILVRSYPNRNAAVRA